VVFAIAAALALGALMTVACNAVLGTGNFVYGDCAEAGAIECEGSKTLVCDSAGHWVSQDLGAVTKIDVLLVVSDGPSMADKQQLLASAVTDLVGGFINPPCVDANRMPVSVQPEGPSGACPAGSGREFPPNANLHVGMITSSLGTFGAGACANDQGHLVTRTGASGSGSVPTYQGLGFLAWDPAQVLTPPGEDDLGNLVTSTQEIVSGAGEQGCRYASQNEAWYRFLVDAAPYGSISLVDGQVVTTGSDPTLVAQRNAFLRPDSLLVIIVLADETDGSIKESGDYPRFADPDLHLPHARQACTTGGPTDPCCASCGDPAPAGCPVDTTCETSPDYTAADENTALRQLGLVSHKQRYGTEYFYPTSRYVQALTSATVTDAMGNPEANPIFAGQKDACGRDGRLVFYAAVTGVPWQLVARQKDGVPDLLNGVSAIDPTQVGGFKTASELSLTDALGNTFWDDIAGDPDAYVPPKSPFMQESTGPRSGTDPITGASISPVSTPNGSGSQVGGALLNDHERAIATPAGDIEYACIFPLATPRDCSAPGASCDCDATSAGNPLCAPNPGDNGLPTLQTHAKAYPGLKHLAIAKGLGAQGIVTSICPKQLGDATQPDYGFRPAIQSILETVEAPLVSDGGAPDSG
jgi:hypothetical protein